MAVRTETEAISRRLTDANIIPRAHDALNKMRRARERGAGCRLTADEIFELSLTAIGELWNQDDPRASQIDGGQGDEGSKECRRAT